MDLSKLTLGDLALAFADLVEKRLQALLSTDVGRAYEPLIKSKAATLAGYIPSGKEPPKPLADQLLEVDRAHDNYGKTIFNYCETVRALPGADPSVQAVAGKIQGTFIPELRELRSSYATEAKAAVARQPKLEAMRVELQATPFPGAGSAYEVIKNFLDAGAKLHSLMSERADKVQERATDGAADITLRSTTLGMLCRLRAALADELEAKPALPRNLDVQVFGYLDELAAMRTAARKRTGEGQGNAEPTAPTAR